VIGVSDARSNARIFLDAHPALDRARAQSTVWPRIKAESQIHIGGEEMYTVAGDTLGGEDELFLDRLARGTRESADSLSRALFVELPETLQIVVLRELMGRT
jgi:hypothetical protein